jgi:hypothetical protein
MLNVVLFLILNSLSAQDAVVPQERALWTVGEVAPHVHLPDIATGRAVDLERYRGKKVLLAEFASW